MPNTTIAFLHTASAHEQTFNDLLIDQPIKTVHSVHEEWLTQARQDGLTDDLIDAVSARLRELADEADVVLCTCSTLGPIAQSLNMRNVLRVDQPMMQAAAAIDGTALLVMCLDSTVDASCVLFESACADADREPDYEVVTCPQAWQHFQDGDQAGFIREIEQTVQTEADVIDNLGCIVLAQASMSVAASSLQGLDVPVLTSPALAVKAALDIANKADKSPRENSPEVG